MAATWFPSVRPMLANYKQEQLVPLFRQIQDRLSAIPGVRSVSAATYAPMSGDQWGHDIRIQGKPEPGPKDDVFADWTRITPGFFDTIGARMLAGRAINEDDNANTRRVAVINEAFAKKFFGEPESHRPALRSRSHKECGNLRDCRCRPEHPLRDLGFPRSSPAHVLRPRGADRSLRSAGSPE